MHTETEYKEDHAVRVLRSCLYVNLRVALRTLVLRVHAEDITADMTTNVRATMADLYALSPIDDLTSEVMNRLASLVSMDPLILVGRRDLQNAVIGRAVGVQQLIADRAAPAPEPVH